MSETHRGKFAVAIACIDGRTVEPVLAYAKQKYGVLYVDRINRPGIDALLGVGIPWWNLWKHILVWLIKKELFISIHHHYSRTVIVSGHCECAGNPVSANEHRMHIVQACAVVRSWGLPEGVEVKGILVNERWEVEEVGP